MHASKKLRAGPGGGFRVGVPLIDAVLSSTVRLTGVRPEITRIKMNQPTEGIGAETKSRGVTFSFFFISGTLCHQRK